MTEADLPEGDPPDPPATRGATALGVTEALSGGRALLDRVGGTTGLARWLKTATGAVSAGVTLVAGVLTVVFLLWPALRPEPGPAAVGATLSEPSLEQRVTLSDYYARRGLKPPADADAARLQQDGVVVGFTVAIEGLAGRACRLSWSLFDANAGARVAEDWLVDQPGWPDGVFTPAAGRDQASGEIWAPPPPRAGRYFVRLELRDPGGKRLATLDSEPFAASAPASGPAPGALPTPASP